MRCADLRSDPTLAGVGAHLYDLAVRLYPLPRSITGRGVRETLAVLGEHADLEVHEVPTGTPVLDWTVPQEWNVDDAYIADAEGRRVVDWKVSNLHLLGYSTPVDARMDLETLRAHLHTDPDHPDAIPFRTSFYEPRWGFCLSQDAFDALAPGEYEVRIDSTLRDGHLTYGEVVLPGALPDEVLVWTHTCHPSLANDNCSGMAVAAHLAALVAGTDRRFSYRFVFGPGTIGSITWLSRNGSAVDRIRHGLVLSNLGDRGAFTYKRSRRGDAAVDRAAAHVISHSASGGRSVEFEPFGYDERQFCSPGFDLPVGSLSRSRYGSYPEYHTSADDLSLIDPASLEESLRVCLEIFAVLEDDGRWINQLPHGEPQLGRRGLYAAIGGTTHQRERELALLWVLNLSDGEHRLLDIAERSGMAFAHIAAAAAALAEHGIVVPA